MQKKELTEKQKEFANELCLLDKEMDRETAELLAKYKDGLELYYPEIPNDIKKQSMRCCGSMNVEKKTLIKRSRKSRAAEKRFIIITMMQIIFMQLSLNNIILI